MTQMCVEVVAPDVLIRRYQFRRLECSGRRYTSFGAKGRLGHAAGLALVSAFLLLFSRTGLATTNKLWFPVGEKLTYKLYWGIIPVGKSTLSSEWIEENGRKYIKLKAVARTGPVVATIYPVEDCIESMVDPDTFLPIRYVQRLKEGRHVRDDTITFDHGAKKAFWKSGLKDESKSLDIGPDTRDVLCLTYYMRPKGTEIGETNQFKVIVDNKLYDLEISVLAKEKIKLSDFGKIRCLKIEPQAKFGAIFVRKGRVMTWFSDDERRICTKMVGKVPVANVKAILVGVEGWEGDWTSPPAKAEPKDDPKSEALTKNEEKD